jgi:hypothetical protein
MSGLGWFVGWIATGKFITKMSADLKKWQFIFGVMQKSTNLHAKLAYFEFFLYLIC